jgi:hypothetical protein
VNEQKTTNYVLPETRAIAVLGLFDLIATIYLLATHRAHEANPLLNNILASYGPAGFALVKALSLAIPLTIAEYARKRNPAFVRRALQIGLIAYVVLLLYAYSGSIGALLGGVAPASSSG